MNKLAFLLISIISLSCFSVSSQGNHPGEYMDHIGEKYNDINARQWEYVKATSRGKSAKKVNKKREELLEEIKNAKQDIAKLPKFNENSSFRDSTVVFLSINYDVINNDYGKIVDMEEVAEQSYDLMEAYMMAKEKAYDKLADAGNRMEYEQHRFAAEHNITLIESESKLSKKMANAGQVYKYFNQLYLIFFKSYKQELYLIDALNKKDIMSIEQNRNALKQSAAQGREDIKNLTSFRGDQSVYLAIRQLLQFYSDEAEDQFAVFTNFLVKEKDFEKIKSSFNQIRSSNRTQKDIDNYNNALKELNSAMREYNDANDKANSQRTKSLDLWNDKSDAFLKKFVQ